MRSEWQVRREIVAIGRQLYQRGLVVGTDGNLSARVHHDAILVTPTGSCLGELRAEELIAIPTELPPLTGRTTLRPTTELPMHLAAYEERPEIGAVIHAHPPLATALTLAGLSLAEAVLPEIVLHLGAVPTAPYATPASEEGARAIRELIRRHDAILLARHGALSVGLDLRDAFHKLERVEHAARVLLAAQTVGPLSALALEEIERLAAMRARSKSASDTPTIA